MVSAHIDLYTPAPDLSASPVKASEYVTYNEGTALASDCAACATLDFDGAVSILTDCGVEVENSTLRVHYDMIAPTQDSPSVTCGSKVTVKYSPTLSLKIYPDPNSGRSENGGYGVYVLPSSTLMLSITPSLASYETFPLSGSSPPTTLERFRVGAHTGVITTGAEIRVASNPGGSVLGAAASQNLPAQEPEIVHVDAELEDVEAGCKGLVNGGFFNTTTLQPLGTHVYHRGGLKVVQKVNRGLGPANVGVGVKDGSVLIGWVPGVNENYDWYVSGLGWLLRGGEMYLDTSWDYSDTR